MAISCILFLMLSGFGKLKFLAKKEVKLSLRNTLLAYFNVMSKKSNERYLFSKKPVPGTLVNSFTFRNGYLLRKLVNPIDNF
jgi:hypothetical protein